jgi:hypothetical protein
MDRYLEKPDSFLKRFLEYEQNKVFLNIITSADNIQGVKRDLPEAVKNEPMSLFTTEQTSRCL